MLKSEIKFQWRRGVIGLLAVLFFGPVNAESLQVDSAKPRQIDVVIALDVSTSMDGLIESAKQRLWDIVNELGRAQPQPDLRLAILSYGNPAYGAQSGYVRVDLPFTRDLDAVSKTLFEFTTNGGDEYVARVIQTAVTDLSWSKDPGALRVLFVAGNEGAQQDPQIAILQATTAAARNGITVNTIYCGDESDGDAPGWRQVATSTNGIFASINQNAAAVANISTPMDQELAELNKELNDTYVAFGVNGSIARENQIEQDREVANMSAPAMASRAASKASPLYRSESWDLVDAVQSGKSLEDVAVKDLPDEMQEMETEQRAAYVEEKAKQRAEVQGRMQVLADDRQDYIKRERAKLDDSDEKGLDEVIQEGLRTLAEEKGFTFTETE
jgi:hypothetical protein